MRVAALRRNDWPADYQHMNFGRVAHHPAAEMAGMESVDTLSFESDHRPVLRHDAEALEMPATLSGSVCQSLRR